MQDTQTVPVQIETRGTVAAEMTVLATSKVRSLLRLANRPVRFARVTLTMAANPAMERPAVARAYVDFDGRAVRAQAAGETMRDAIEQMADRLRRRLERATRNWETRRGTMPTGTAGEWRHQSIPAHRPTRPGTTA
jgi:ribosome-associated translation inhibitor RaiA